MQNTNINTLADGIAALRPASGETPDTRQIRALAMQFESLLLGTLLKEMRESTDDGSKTSAENAPLFGSLDTELALALSRAGGLGMADSLASAFGRQLPPMQASPMPPGLTTTSTAGPSAPLPAEAMKEAIESARDYSAPAGRVSSAFGWRNDPIRGDRSFHHGTDIAMPVGQDVPVAGAGRVAFVGEQNGYGLTVVVQHPDGLETRYAHLSATLVSAGDSVTKGQAVARSGNSGRSTGPHLHFEVRRNGQSVDPAGLQ